MQIYTYACKWFKCAETCFRHSWEFALQGCSENVIADNLNWLTPAPHSPVLPRFVQFYFHLDENTHKILPPSQTSYSPEANAPALSHEAVAPQLCLASLGQLRAGLQSITRHHLSMVSPQKNPNFSVVPKTWCRGPYTAHQVSDRWTATDLAF